MLLDLLGFSSFFPRVLSQTCLVAVFLRKMAQSQDGCFMDGKVQPCLHRWYFLCPTACSGQPSAELSAACLFQDANGCHSLPYTGGLWGSVCCVPFVFCLRTLVEDNCVFSLAASLPPTSWECLWLAMIIGWWQGCCGLWCNCCVFCILMRDVSSFTYFLSAERA